MKKKLLFVMESLRIGGAEKSLVTILSLLDKSKYDISLYLFRPTGEFMEQLPSDIRVVPVPEIDAVQKNFKTDWIAYLIKGEFKRSFWSLRWLLGCCISKFLKREDEYIGWNNCTHLYSDLADTYDIAVGFLEKRTTYFVVDHVTASKKIAFMHTDYDSIPHNEELDKKYFEKLDYLAVVSEHTGETMLSHFPFLKNRIKVIKNMVSPEIIREMAKAEAPEIKNSDCEIKIVTVGRLTKQKNIDGAIIILKMLIDCGIDAEWFVIGDGEERNNLEKDIAKLNLEDRFHLLGAKSNPYPYMKQCDIYVQPSRWEGYGITVAEAKVLCKPIVTSDIPEFREQLKDGMSGVICNNRTDFINNISRLVNDKLFYEHLVDNLKNEITDFNELNKFIDLLEG